MEALISIEKEIIHLDGHKVLIKKMEFHNLGDVIRIKKEGMAIHNKGDNGELFITLKIQFPQKN